MLIFPGPLYCRIYDDAWTLIEGSLVYLQVLKTYPPSSSSSTCAPTKIISLYDHCISFIDGISSLLALDDSFQETNMDPNYYDLSLALIEVISQVPLTSIFISTL